ncbi:myb-like protein X [Echeneis naucrates]|uniref:myb-like protein X n=1 Tax=Echeneis naucrates TaxID=173247 RepID=UPI00111337AB|nr:myb-like protein X [Echeneis naucrates]
MLSKKEEQRSFSNGKLRDQWEKRAQSIADQRKQEAEWREKNSVKVLFSKWNYHWSVIGQADMSDFRRVTTSTDESKPKVKFRIVPPPPKVKAEPPPAPPTPRRRASPKRHRPQRKVEVDVFRLCWKESWMSLKPPKYLYLRAKESKTRIPGFTTIELINNREYKPQMKRLGCLELSGEKQFQWGILSDKELVSKSKLEAYSLPVWAGTWKIMNFAFRQQKKDWDCNWPNYPKSCHDKSDELRHLEQQDRPSGWEESWKQSGAELTAKNATDDKGRTRSFLGTDIKVIARIIDVFLPDWNNSWLLSGAAPQKEKEHEKNWFSCWGFRQQIRWCKASLQSHHQHSDMMMMMRSKSTNLFLTSLLDEDIKDSTEWTDAWRIPKGWMQVLEDEVAEEEENDTGDDEDEGVDEEEEEEECIDADENEYEAVEKDERDVVHQEKEKNKNDSIDEEDEGVEEEENEEGNEKEMEIHNREEEDEEEQKEEDDRGDKINWKGEDNDFEKRGGCTDEDKEKEKDIDEKEQDQQVPKQEEDININSDCEEDEEQRKEKIVDDKEEELGNEEEKIHEKGEDDDDEKEEKINENNKEEGSIAGYGKPEESGKIINEKGEEHKEDEKTMADEKNKEKTKDVDKEGEDKEVNQEDESHEEENETEDEGIDKEQDKRDEEEMDEVGNEDDHKQEDIDIIIDEEEGDDEKENKENEVTNQSGEEDHLNEKEIEDEEIMARDQRKEADDEKEEDQKVGEEEDNDDDEDDEVDDEENDEGDDEDDDKEVSDSVDTVNEGYREDDFKVEKEEEKEKEKKKPNVPLHLQFHKLNTSFSSWKQSWMVAVAHRAGDEDEEEDEDEDALRAWRDSWRICRWQKPDTDEVMCFSTEHQRQRYVGVMNEEETCEASSHHIEVVQAGNVKHL